MLSLSYVRGHGAGSSISISGKRGGGNTLKAGVGICRLCFFALPFIADQEIGWAETSRDALYQIE
jgi:hypothetical protein